MIRVGAKEIRPASPMVFAALLYLAVERGRRVPRAALQELLFPNSAERSGAHSLRQLLYKLRQLGAPVSSDATGVRVESDAVTEDSEQRSVLDAMLSRNSAESFAVLPGYDGLHTEAFDQWLGNYRDSSSARVRSFLEQSITCGRHNVAWAQVERDARLLIRIDTLNEVGVLALAQAVAMSGSTASALKVIDEYCADLGESNVTSTVRRVRARLRDKSLSTSPTSSPGHLCGRDADLATLLDLLRRQDSNGRAVLVSGAAGIGKTRLIQEFGSIASFEGFRVEWCTCSEADVQRPCTVLSRLVSRLLRAPGALGTTPASLELLTRLTDAPLRSDKAWANAAENEALRSTLVAAVKELIESVASERPLCLVVEDVQWIDPWSRESLVGVVTGDIGQPVFLVLTSRERSLFAVPMQHSRIVSVALDPLSDEAASAVLLHLLDGAKPDFVTWAVRVASGNPFFLSAIASFYRHTGASFQLPPSLRVLIRQSVESLDGEARALLDTAAILAGNSSINRLARARGLDTRSLLPSLRDLETRGLIRSQDDWVGVAHDLLREEVLALLPPASTSVLHGIVADILYQEARASGNAALLWDCADHWHSAGELRRSVQVVLSCADHLVAIGEVNAAYELVVRAQSLRLEALMAYRLARMAAIISFNTGNVVAARMQIALMRQLSGSLKNQTVDRDELELFEGEIQRLGGNSISDRVPALLTLLGSDAATLQHRLHAARLLLIHADISLDEGVAHRAINVVRSLGSGTPADATLRLSCQLIFEASFGQAARVPEIVAAFDISVADQPVALTIRHRVNTAVALFRAGQTDEAFRRLITLYDIGRSLKSRETAFVAASKVVLLYGLLGEVIPPNWLEAVREIESDSALSKLLLLEFRCLELVQSAPVSDVEEALTRYREFVREGELGRGFTMVEMIEIWLAIRKLDHDQLRHHCNRLLSVHERAAVYGIYDSEMETLYRGLCELGERSRARYLLREYVRNQRRDAFPMRKSLQVIVKGLDDMEDTILAETPAIRLAPLSSSSV